MPDEEKRIPITTAEKELFRKLMPDEYESISRFGAERRHFLKLIALAGGSVMAAQLLGTQFLYAGNPTPPNWELNEASYLENPLTVSFTVNNTTQSIEIDSRMTLLDVLRERLQLTGSKKGCDHGQCGACTVIVDERRVLSCLTLAATCQDKKITTVEGLASGKTLHPMQEAFINHDGFQCGYCTPGQICSAVALIEEAKKGDASYVTKDIRKQKKELQLSAEEIRERMSGNLCRCGAYPNIVASVMEVHSGKDISQPYIYNKTLNDR